MKCFLFIFLIFIILSCNLDISNSYKYFELKVYNENDLINELKNSKQFIIGALEYFYSTNLLNNITNLYNNGILLKLVLDYNTNQKKFLLEDVPVRYRNINGIMCSHFFIIDNKKVIIFPSSKFVNYFPVIIFYDEKVINNFLTEFDNLYNSDEKGKMELNFQKEFIINGNKIGIYFLPQNDYLKYINNILGNIQNNIECYFDYLNNEVLQKYLYNIINSGIENKIYFGINQTNYLKNSFFMILSNKYLINSELNYNVVFIDIMKENQSCILFNVNLDRKNLFSFNDGIIISIVGNSVSNFYNELKNKIEENSIIFYTNNNVNFDVGYTNIIFSEINWMGVIRNNGESDPEGEFIEIKNITHNPIDISRFKIIISNNISNFYSFIIPENTILDSNSFYVIVRKKNIYSNYNVIWSDFYLANNGFKLLLLDRKNNIIDKAGEIGSIFSGTSYNPRRTMVRKLDPVLDGDKKEGWRNADEKYNLYKDYFYSNIANPGIDDKFVVIYAWSNYYANAYGKSGNELKKALHDIIKGHTVLPYTSVGKDTWKALKDVDQDPYNPGNVILIYTGESVSSDPLTGNWNREHVWSKSHGFPNENQPPYTDIHHLRPCNSLLNSYRGNNDFAPGGVIVSNTRCKYVKDTSFEPADEFKGDVARMMFYMAVRYEGDSPGEPDLELGNFQLPTPSSVPPHTNGVFGQLSNLILWHLNDPPDKMEIIRNNKIYSNWQGNRNPFIDHPEWVTNIWKLN